MAEKKAPAKKPTTRKSPAKKAVPPPTKRIVIEEAPEIVTDTETTNEGAVEVEAKIPDDVITRILGMEAEVKDAAATWPDGDNSDAVKYQLSAVAGAIGALSNALRVQHNLERAS